ncbi:kinase-like protein [Conidiobolus coronatus NRRL 28638]|uniref:Kinase-like protein n=1 Tax=Conidiobolus coronatus (strain ATCC 28846 / CBS 209.66 / NRRL 28638) TaxID=796925 RepID=A0A137P1L6_CONC2|nr:kinase-like protein [Conidiobolus coronatus NRRL 28638]|eukprot:KXN68769.1 kinase-like protein [Conidiobolus coronatus NRRL 28638]
MAPEMYEEKGYSEKVDIYAMGMCLLEMVTGEYPYSECQNAAQIYRKVSQGIKPACLCKVHDTDLLNLINNCLAPENDRLSAQEILDHPFLAADPEVILLTQDSKKELTLQVVFKGTDRLSVKFEFNCETDTAEEVVREMIEENVLPQRYQHLITFEINRILRELNKPSYYASLNQGSYHGYRNQFDKLDLAKKELAMANERALEAEKKAELSEQRAKLAEDKSRGYGSTGSVNESFTNHEQDPSTQKSVSSLTSSGKNILMNALKMFRGEKAPEDVPNSLPRTESLPVTNISTQPLKDSHSQWFADEEQDTLINKEYPDDCPVEEIVQDTVLATNRGPEKIVDWLAKLHAQDIVTVGDLRDLHEADWASLGLTVFASRALRNSLQANPSYSQTLSGSATPTQSRQPIPIISTSSQSSTGHGRSESLSGSHGGGRPRSTSSSYERSPTLFRNRSIGHSG